MTGVARPPRRLRHAGLSTGAVAAIVLVMLCILLAIPAVRAEPLPSAAPELIIRQVNTVTATTNLPTAAVTIESQPSPTTSTNHDPLLAIMPDFVFSMPAQIIVDGVNLALVCILAIQLLFTAHYHYPFSRKNYILLTSSTFLLLVNTTVHLNALLSRLHKQSRQWPYMFAYIGVQVPPDDGTWTTAQMALYLLLKAITIALVHLTHIQFLTLLFPSALEARLILWMLGPLALAASGMEFTALASNDDLKTSDLGDAIRNICNSTLFLLYTSALLIWGTLVNRRRAWRTDGGTAAFGGGALGLAFINTIISFIEIAYDRVWWLPDLCWTLTVWQSWLGFWWWVGAGMGIGEVEDRAERQERKRKKEEKIKRKREREKRQQEKAMAGPTGAGAAVAAASSSLSGNSDAIIGSFRRLRGRLAGSDGRGDQNSTLSRRRQQAHTGAAGEDGEPTSAVQGEEGAQQGANGDAAPLTSIAIDAGPAEGDDEARTAADSSDTQPTTSGAATSTTGIVSAVTGFLAAHQPGFIKRRMRRLRLAHVEAAQRAATEQSALREQVLNRQSASNAPGLRTMISTNRSTQTGESILRASESATSPRNTSEFSRHINSSRLPTSPTLYSSSPLSPSRSLQPGGLQSEWVDEEVEGARQEEQVDAEDEVEVADSITGQASRPGSTHSPTSWSWRGGLQTLRMRDHTTYD